MPGSRGKRDVRGGGRGGEKQGKEVEGRKRREDGARGREELGKWRGQVRNKKWREVLGGEGRGDAGSNANKYLTLEETGLWGQGGGTYILGSRKESQGNGKNPLVKKGKDRKT